MSRPSATEGPSVAAYGRTYDVSAELTTATNPDGATVSTAYNADGQVESSTDANGNL